MAISKSGKKDQGWIAGALLYSGRPDPTWNVPRPLVTKLQSVWKSLPATGEKHEPEPGMLGYRGAFLRGPGNREWLAGNGLVFFEEPSRKETRKDVAREFEKELLSSAPSGLLPEGLLTGGWS